LETRYPLSAVGLRRRFPENYEGVQCPNIEFATSRLSACQARWFRPSTACRAAKITLPRAAVIAEASLAICASVARRNNEWGLARSAIRSAPAPTIMPIAITSVSAVAVPGIARARCCSGRGAVFDRFVVAVAHRLAQHTLDPGRVCRNEICFGHYQIPRSSNKDMVMPAVNQLIRKYLPDTFDTVCLDVRGRAWVCRPLRWCDGNKKSRPFGRPSWTLPGRHRRAVKGGRR
jgi:hypothetical protein